MTAADLSPSLFALFSAFIEQQTGIQHGIQDADILGSKLRARAQQAGFESLLEYYYLLRYDDPGGVELEAMIDALVVPETYFFREFAALTLAVDDFVVPRVRAAGHARVWCAACASGEEPLTVCMLLAEHGVLDSVELVASDVSARVLQRAKAGKFGARALRDIPDRVLSERYLERTPAGVRVRGSLASHVDFRQVNLTDAATVASLGSFDLILCRNVLIYFGDHTAAGVVQRLGAALRPGGALFVGVAESLLRLGTALSCEERAGSFFYRRVDR